MSPHSTIPKDGLVLQIVQWSARIISGLLIIYCIAMFVNSMLHHGNKDISFSPDAWDGLMIATAAFFLIGISGLIVGFVMEGEGGLVSLLGMGSFLFLTKYNPNANFTILYFIFIIPSLLYILYWWLEKQKIHKYRSTHPIHKLHPSD